MHQNKIEYFDDYVNYRGTIVKKEDVYTYYIVYNHSKIETIEHFQISNDCLSNAFKKWGIRKSKKQAHLLNEKTQQERYGDPHYNNHEKYKQTMLEKYGIDNIFKDTDYIAECRRKKIGVAYPAQDKTIQNKIQNTCRQRYGEHYEIITEKRKKTCRKQYGVDFVMQVPEFARKCAVSGNFGRKAFETKKRNGTTNTSKPEENFYSWLLTVFDRSDIKRNYKCSLYPWHCDFYISSINTFIELNLFWTHGDEPYIGTDEQIELVKKFEEKVKEGKPQYKTAIEVWTKVDVAKRNTAVMNNLRYFCVYNSEQINELKEKLVNDIKC